MLSPESATTPGFPSISVVIPVRNGMPFIKQALASVLSHAGQDVEVIVRENWSTDGTREWLESQDTSAFTLLIADKPASAAENWTAACEAATGKYIKLLCADDYMLDGGLARQAGAAAAHPDAVLIASRRRIVNHDGNTVFPRRGLPGLIGTVGGTKAARKAALSGTNPFGEPSAVLFRADALRKSLPWGADFPYVTDLQMYFRVLQLGSFVGLYSADAAFRLSNASWSQQIGNKQLTQYRSWVRSLEVDGTLRRGPVTLLVSESRYFATFVARRLATFLARVLAR